MAEARDHAATMDAMYRYQRHFYDLTRKYYLFGRDRLIAGLDCGAGDKVLEIACGTGRNLVQIARRYPSADLYGLDISEQMLVSARAKFRNAASPPRLLVADACDFTPATFGQSGFDRIVISYALSMIPDWQQALRLSIGALNPGGSLHIVDFGQQEGLPAWFRAALVTWLSRFHVNPRADMLAVLEAGSAGARLRFEPIGRGYAWHAVLQTQERIPVF
ncbi:class I SAM-dependent methyltransferase [Martelella soudanensis]|uniref:class I SAM-dependent methyltransferase n=1 Tax=unclassified Martelella TaxID=2629616 RepID=UPI0015DF115C|nr:MULTISPECIES: class I SAM-dependent methyltransferase [unclassified Martelella]